KWVDRWIGQGATVVGGCCGIGPEHIEAIRAFRDGRAANSAPRSNI
ncbi:MAG: homocysteine S-methyltransferase family protein, partial [Mesorhizobium sp.]